MQSETIKHSINSIVLQETRHLLRFFKFIDPKNIQYDLDPQECMMLKPFYREHVNIN